MPHRENTMVIDIDFLRGGSCQTLEADAFWDRVWTSLGTEGIFVINAIGAELADIETVSHAALARAPACADICAGVIEPSIDIETAWSTFHPRPAVLVIGPLAMLHLLSDVAALRTELLRVDLAWATLVCRDVLEHLELGKGLAGSWRLIERPSPTREL